MDRAGLRVELARLGVPADAVTVDGDRDESYCLRTTGAGFAVFYSERGRRTGERLPEDEACADLLSRVLRDGTVAQESRPQG